MNLCMHSFRRFLTIELTLSVLLFCLGYVSFASAALLPKSSSSIVLYPHSSLEYQKISSGEEHRFLLSTPRRISNTLQIEKEVLLAGERNDLLLKITSTGTNKAAFLYYQKLLTEQGEVLYSCEERACGTSSYWANKIFNEGKLYGRDGDQYYLAGRLRFNEQNYFVSVYVVQNGRKHEYVYLSYVLDKTGESVVSNDKQESGKFSRLSLWKQGVSFEKPSLKDEQLAFIKETLANDKSLSLWVVGFSDISEGQKVMDAISLSEKALNAFSREVSRQLQINAERIIVKNIGPFEKKPDNYFATTWFRLYLR